MVMNKSNFSLFSRIRILLKKNIKKNLNVDEVLDESFRFSSTLSFDAPDGHIESINKDNKTGIYHLSIFGNGLTGATGALPTVYTEWLIGRKIRYNDTAPKAFLDMFDHRMYCLSYLAWQKMHLAGDENTRVNNVLNNVLLALGGGWTSKTMSLTGLEYTAFYAQSVRSLCGLEQFLSSLYKIPVNIFPFRGSYQIVERCEQCMLGDVDYSLGEGPIIGNVRWVIDSHFDIIIGPVYFNNALNFMSGRKFNKLIKEQVRSYIGATPQFNIKLLVYSSKDDNKLSIENKLGFNICVGEGIISNNARFLYC